MKSTSSSLGNDFGFDVLTSEQRKFCMSKIRGRDTEPEMRLRKALFSMGLRYRLNYRNLPGRPDLVFSSYKSVIFVHGCFWHGHKCHMFKWPKTNAAFWRDKIERNVQRDSRNNQQLLASGWRVMLIWECLLRGKHRKPIEMVANYAANWIRSGAQNRRIELNERFLEVNHSTIE